MLERYGEDTHVRAFDGDPGRVTEMDALVAYLQILGGLTDAADITRPRRRSDAMDIGHDTLVAFAKTFGLFYLIALSVGVVIYAFWPSHGGRFDRAAKSVLEDEDGPCR